MQQSFGQERCAHVGSVNTCMLAIQLEQAVIGLLVSRRESMPVCRISWWFGLQVYWFTLKTLFGRLAVGCSFSLVTSDWICNQHGRSLSRGMLKYECRCWPERRSKRTRHVLRVIWQVFLPQEGQQASPTQPKLHIFALESSLSLQEQTCFNGMDALNAATENIRSAGLWGILLAI